MKMEQEKKKSNVTLSVNDAVIMAKKRDPDLNCYQEYIDAYYFFLNDGIFRVGGSGNGFVIKKDGTLLKPYEYFMNPDSKAEKIGEEKFI